MAELDFTYRNAGKCDLQGSFPGGQVLKGTNISVPLKSGHGRASGIFRNPFLCFMHSLSLPL